MKNMDKKKKIILIVSLISLVLILLIGGTVAFFGWRADDALVNVTVSSGTGSCDLISDNDIVIEPVSSRDGGRIVKLSAKQQMATKAYIEWNMVVNNIGELQHESLIYELVNTSTGVSYGSGNFSGITNEEGSNTIKFSNSEELLDYNVDYEFTLYLWIDGASFNNPYTMGGEDFNFDISCSITGYGESNGGNSNTLATHIVNLYSSGNPTVGTNTNVSTYYQSYQDEEKTWGLMNDGYEGVTKITDTTALTSGTKGNIRYYGANPNNYIYFNCETYPDTNCEVWRIIGIVDGKVKIARATVLNYTMSWDSTANNWENASLKIYLNEDYYTSLETKNPDTLDLISYSTWYLGGYSASDGLYADDIYGYERTESTETIYTGNPPSIEENIGLMYASDYSYGTDLNSCSKNIYNYDTDTNCKNKDWLLKSGVETQINTTQWLITPRSSYSGRAWYVDSTGCVGYGYGVYNTGGVRPVLYLNSELVIESGHEGTIGDPYRISVS